MLEIENTEQQEEAMARKNTKENLKEFQSRSVSPTKPPGILLTPGTATSRRKTVSFGHDILQKAGKNRIELATPKDATEKGPGSREVESDHSSKSTRLNRVLENAREGKAGRSGSEKSRSNFDSQPLLDLDPRAEEMESSKARVERRASRSRKSNQDLRQECMTGEHFDGDMTTDLNEPHSQSGKYWKFEFEQYHDEARAEMKKLTKYKNLAKSYAKKKDAEAADLTAKLKEEQRRVACMEDKVSKLSAQIAAGGVDGKEDDSPMLIQELARQNALAVQYRAQVEEFRVALEGEDGEIDMRTGEERLTSPRKAQALLETQRELKKARERLKEKDSIHDELRDLKKRLSAAEASTKKLQDENAKLSQELLQADLRLEREMEKSEKRRQGSQERLKKKDEALQALQKDYDSLKESAKSQRRDAEHLLKKRHDLVVELKKELTSQKGAESIAKDLQQALHEKNSCHSKIISDYQRQISRLISTQSEDIQPATLPTKATLMEATQLTRTVTSNNENLLSRESHIPVLSQSITRPLTTLDTTKNSLPEHYSGISGLRTQSSHSALSEILHCKHSETQPQPMSSSMQYTPLVHRFSNLSLDTPDMQLPSPESSILSQAPVRAIHERNCHASPRPAMFVIPLSPPKRVMMRTELARQRSISSLANVSNRLLSLDNSRTKSTLPPERAAAAKARLQQKNAEKKIAKEMGAGKENFRN